jgi:acetyl-CoA acetyltransferase
MNPVYIIAAHTTRFGKYPDRGIKDLSAETVQASLRQAGLTRDGIQALWFANSGWGYGKGQECIRGQVALRPLGIERIPITNVENACAGGSTALHHAWLGVASGLYDVTMAVGAEKLFHANRWLVFAGFLGGMDIENIETILPQLSEQAMTDAEREQMRTQLARLKSNPAADSNNDAPLARSRGTATLASPQDGARRRGGSVRRRLSSYLDMCKVGIRLGEQLGYDTLLSVRKSLSGEHSPFMDAYGFAARRHMREFGSTPDELAIIAAKNHYHSSLNPNAQYNFTLTPEQVLADRMVSWPLTRAMCAPIGDGAASAILCSAAFVRRLGLGSQAVLIRASIPGSGSERRDPGALDIAARLAAQAYERANLGPADVDTAEVHDATAFGELHQCETLGFCPEGEGGLFAASGATRLGGRLPVNPSGGLESRGHPVAASGLAQIHELVTQLRGAAGPRQVAGARIGLAENGGGSLGPEEAAMCIHILEAPNKK